MQLSRKSRTNIGRSKKKKNKKKTSQKQTYILGDGRNESRKSEQILWESGGEIKREVDSGLYEEFL